MAARATRPAALVTGAGKRLGRAFAIALADAGFPVIVHAREADTAADETRSLIEGAGGHAAVVAADLSDRSAVSTLIGRAAESFGPLGLLVNCASVFEDDRMGSITPESWDLHFSTNLYAPVMLAQAFAAQAERLPEGGDPSIVNILDQRVLKPNPQFFSYSLTKAALHWATITLAQALAPRVRVNGIGPGPTLPNAMQTPEAFAAEAEATLLGRASTLGDLERALLYLADARAVTGQMIAVDSGQHLNWRTPDIEGP
jgi:NAD(P)-dependent dehydrogenase (short-subunit alcohol dehydrogenase family)